MSVYDSIHFPHYLFLFDSVMACPFSHPVIWSSIFSSYKSRPLSVSTHSLLTMPVGRNCYYLSCVNDEETGK